MNLCSYRNIIIKLCKDKNIKTNNYPCNAKSEELEEKSESQSESEPESESELGESLVERTIMKRPK